MKQASETANTGFSHLHDVVSCALPDVEALALEGPDAVAFAHSQLASDVAALAVGAWQWTCLLSPQGRVVVLGLLLRPDADRLLLLAPGARAAELLARLQRFVLRRRVVLSVAGIAVRGEGGGAVAPVPFAGGAIARDGETLRVELGGVAGRLLRLGGAAAPPDAAAREAWRRLDAVDGIPWIEGAAVESWIPQALGLGRLAAFSTRKGCYPGQEIVARTHFLGRNKREPRRGILPAGVAAPAPGTRLLAAGAADDAEAAGEVVLAAAGTVLAVVREDAPALLRPAGSAEEIAFEPLPAAEPAGAAAAKML